MSKTGLGLEYSSVLSLVSQQKHYYEAKVHEAYDRIWHAYAPTSLPQSVNPDPQFLT